MSRPVLAALAAFALWGLLPLYWKQLDTLSAWTIASHRNLWCLLALALWLPFRRRGWRREGMNASSGRVIRFHLLSALLLAANWLIYIWATTAGHIIESSLGYFLNPLVSIAIGALLLGERLSRLQWAAVALAGAGVGVQVFALGHLPWIALILATTFAIYGLMAKRSSLESQPALFLESALLLPLALVWLSWPGSGGWHALAITPVQTWLLLGAGLVSLAPLVLFGIASRGLPLSTVGILQFLAPTLQFLVGWLVYHESMQPARWASFACIWFGLILYVNELRRKHRAKTIRVLPK